MLHGQRQRADTSSDRHGRQMNRNSGPAVTDLGDKPIEMLTKDCKAEAATAAQSWETNVKDCKAETDTAVQSGRTHLKKELRSPNSKLFGELFFKCEHDAGLFLFICLPGLSMVVSTLFRWQCSISIYSFVSQVGHCQCPPFSAGHVLFISQGCVRPCPPFSAGHVAFLFFCLPGPSLLVPCSISIHLSFRSVTGGVRPCPLAMKHFYSFVSQVRYCWCPPFSVGHVAFLFICLPGVSLLVSALFRRQCSISIHLSPSSVTAGVRPFPSAMQHFCSLVSHVISFFLSFRFGACTAVFSPVRWNRFTCERFLLL